MANVGDVTPATPSSRAAPRPRVAARDPASRFPEERVTALAPRPVTLEQTGLTLDFVAELVLKSLLQLGVTRASGLGERVALAGPILERVTHFLRREGLIEVRPRPSRRQ